MRKQRKKKVLEGKRRIEKIEEKRKREEIQGKKIEGEEEEERMIIILMVEAIKFGLFHSISLPFFLSLIHSHSLPSSKERK